MENKDKPFVGVAVKIGGDLRIFPGFGVRGQDDIGVCFPDLKETVARQKLISFTIHVCSHCPVSPGQLPQIGNYNIARNGGLQPVVALICPDKKRRPSTQANPPSCRRLK